MAKIEVGRFSELLRRYLSMAGVVEVASELAPEISPVFILEAQRPEWEFIKGQRLCASSFNVSGEVGVQNVYRLRNPANSGVIAVISQVMYSLQQASVIHFVRNNQQTDLPDPQVTVTRDTRYPALNVSALRPSSDGVAFNGDSIWSQRVLADVAHREKFDFVLTPGFCIEIGVDGIALDFRGSILWLERRIGELEVG